MRHHLLCAIASLMIAGQAHAEIDCEVDHHYGKICVEMPSNLIQGYGKTYMKEWRKRADKEIASRTCANFSDGQKLTLHGMATQGVTGEGDDNEGEPSREYVDLTLDSPICGETGVVIDPSPKGPFPRHMTVTGCLVAGDGWTLNTTCR